MRMDNTGIPPSDTIVEVRQLWTAFGSGAKQVVIHKDLDLTIRRGEVLTLVGGSGTGKTVLLRQILGLETPTRGSVTVLDRPAAELGRSGAASRVGMLFQHGALFSALNVFANVAFPLREFGVRDEVMLRDLVLLKLAMAELAPDVALRMPAELSGGMIKRVALARALALEPELLILDEPTAGLDPDLSAGFVRLIRALHKALGLTVILVTHDLDTLAALATRVAVLSEGRILAFGPLDEIMTVQDPFIERFFHSERSQAALARGRAET